MVVLLLLGTRHALSLSLVTRYARYMYMYAICRINACHVSAVLCSRAEFRLVPLVFPRIIDITAGTHAHAHAHRHFARPLGLSLNFAAAHHRHGLRGTEAQ